MAYADAVLALTPYVYWRMGGIASPVQDETVSNVDLQVGDGITFGAGPIADAVSFDGVSGYGYVPALDLDDTDELTVVMFVSFPSYTNDNSPLWEFAPGWDLTNGSLFVNPNNAAVGEAGTISIAFRSGGTISRWTIPQSAIPVGGFHQFVLRASLAANTLDVFVDGVEVTTTQRASAATPGNFASAELVLMTRSGLYTEASLAEVSIHKALLEDAEIAGLFAAAIPDIPVLAYQSTGGLGGAIGGALASSVNVLFGQPTNAQRLAGLTDYRCVYLKNLGPDTLEDVRVWVQTASTETDAAEAIGEDTGNPAQTIASATTAPAGVSFSAPANYAGGLTLGDLDQGDAVPVWVRRVVSAGAAQNDVSFVLGASWTDAEDNALVTISYEIIVPITLYVNADHAARSDLRSREDAADDPDLPFATMQAAAMLLQRGDTLQVEPSTLGNANPSDTIDPDVYAGVISDGSTTILTAANNAGNDPIRVVAHIVDGVRPKLRRLDFFQLNNWQFEGFQKGYDRGSGNDNNTVSGLQDCTDLTFTNILSTGGGWNCVAGSGRMRWEQCITYSPFVDGNPNFLNGTGFHVLGLNTGTGVNTTGDWEFIDGWFEGIEGEDCVQYSLGDPSADTELERGGTMTIRGNTFKDIILNPDLTSPPHTDCIQNLGCRLSWIVGNRFINCIQPYIASDHENGRTFIAKNLVDGCQNGLWLQGTSLAIYAHNTIKGLFSGIAIGRRLNETIPDFVTKLIIFNNICTSLSFDTAVDEVDPTSYVADNVTYQAPGQVTPWGTQISGSPEFGPSARLVSAGLTEGDVSDWGDPSGRLELANSPVESSGIGDGRSLADLGLTDDEIAELATDILGRAYASPRDCGALQSDPGTLITPAPRPPYVLHRSPSPDQTGVAGGADVTFDLVPVPGHEVDASTVSAATVYVTDATAFLHIPARVTLGALLGGSQAVRVELLESLDPDVEGDLFPLVLYTAFLDGVMDTQASEIPLTTWSFRIAGTGSPAIGSGTGPGVPDPTFTMGGVPWSVGATVKVYPASAFPTGATGPSGPPVDSAAVGAASTITFDGLTEGIRYVAFAEGRAVNFMVPSPVFRTVRVQ